MQAFKYRSLKTIIAIAAATIGIAAYQPAQATQFTASGRVQQITATDSGQGANTNSFLLVGVSSLGNCATFFGTLVLFRMKDDLHGQQMYATVLAAAASGTGLIVNADDTNRDSGGACYAINVTMGGN